MSKVKEYLVGQGDPQPDLNRRTVVLGPDPFAHKPNKYFGLTDEEIEVMKATRGAIVTTLPISSPERKNYPLFRGVLRYFPAALAGIAYTSKIGNDKHNPGEPLHHARDKSTDQGDCILRHLTDVEDLLAARDRGTIISNEQILNEVNQMAWRALAFSQELHEKLGAPLAPAASNNFISKQDLK